MEKGKFYICKHCGNFVGMIENSGVPIVCCGEEMSEVVANTVEASVEKHLPVIEINDNLVSVKVGSVLHPMEEEHHISFIYIETENGGQRKVTRIGSNPEAEFLLNDDKLVAVYAYCNLHGLWKVEA